MTFGIIGNITKPVITEVARNLLGYLTKKRLPFVVHEDLAAWLKGSLPAVSEEDLPRQCTMVISLGGDGTMLTAARIVGPHQIPILGINLGKLGFLAEVSIAEVEECIDDILKGKYRLDERMVIMAKVSGDSRVYYALNEIVVDRGSSARVIELETSVDDDYLVTYSADGLIVATPTGSTAYSLASGGPIVTPPSRVITISPISAHTLTARPVVVPEEGRVRIKVAQPAKTVHITADGQVEGAYDPPVEFSIARAPFVAKLVKRTDRTYFDLLRAKLMWGSDLRITKK